MVIPLLANQGLTPMLAGRICKCKGGNAGQGASPRKFLGAYQESSQGMTWDGKYHPWAEPPREFRDLGAREKEEAPCE